MTRYFHFQKIFKNLVFQFSRKYKIRNFPSFSGPFQYLALSTSLSYLSISSRYFSVPTKPFDNVYPCYLFFTFSVSHFSFSSFFVHNLLSYILFFSIYIFSLFHLSLFLYNSLCLLLLGSIHVLIIVRNSIKIHFILSQ